jgi:hypothetical protein
MLQNGPGPGGPSDSDYGFGVNHGDNRIDIYDGFRGYPGHGHTVLEDIDGDGELEVRYDRTPGGDVRYDDSG